MAFTGSPLYPSTSTSSTFAGLFPGSTDYPGGTDYPGDVLAPAADLFPGSTTFAGQGIGPVLQILISVDDVSVANPSWTYVADSKERAASISRGRDSELSEFDAGTATVTLDNRNRAYDPLNNASIRPFNRLWLREQFSGETHDLIKGYVFSWDLEYPNGGFADATATAEVTDELAVLAAAALPTTSPPRDSYSELVMSDNPVGYWDFNEDPALRTRVATSVPAETNSSELSGTDFTVELKRGDRRAFPSKHARRRN